MPRLPIFLPAAATTLFLQLLFTALTFLTSLVVAWLGGDGDFGAYSTVFTWLFFFSIVAMYGGDDLASKQIPIYLSQNTAQQIAPFMRLLQVRLLLSSAAIFLLLLLLIEVLALPSFVAYRGAYYIGAVSVPAYALLMLMQAALRAMGNMFYGQLVEKLLLPSFFILFLLLLAYFFPPMQYVSATVARTASFLLVAMAAIALFYRILRKRGYAVGEEPTRSSPEERNAWQKSSTYFMLTSLLYAVSTRIDIALLDLFQTAPASIAHYNAAARFADVLGMPFMLAATVALPTFSRLYHANNRAELQRFYSQITLFSFGLTAVGVAILCLWGDFFLSWFGENFKAGYEALLPLAFARLLHAFTGPAAALLMMSGYERVGLFSTLLSVALSLLLQSALIPYFGILGAAYGAFCALAVFELVQMILLYRCLGLRPLFLGWLRA